MNQSSISFRSFARGLDWPPALLSDLVHGHRGLSVARAIEFGRHCGMSSLDIQRLIMLTLGETENPTVRDFVQRFVNEEVRSLPETVTKESPSKIADNDLSALHMLLVWSDGQITAEEIGKLLRFSPALKDPVVLAEKLQILRDYGHIEGDLPNIRLINRSTAAEGMTFPQFFSTLDYLRPIASMEKPRGQFWQMGRLTIPRHEYPEFCQRMRSLINWAQNRAAQDNPSRENPRTDYLLMQFNFMLTSLLEFDELGFVVHKDPESGSVRIETTV